MLGRTLAHYRITGALGAGGMGEVWRATDTRLGREVALKLLPEAFISDPERLTRFEREAKLLASLSHPSIASIYGLEEIDGQRILVLELALGETLAERLERGAIAIKEALSIACQIAEALEEDLTPANAKVSEEGKVKVVDFGLAKALSEDGASGVSSELSLSPTRTSPATHAGMILGTAAYMSPEQARGKSVDKRADVWAFGVVLFEMLTGKRLFTGETVSDVLAAVLKREVEWNSLPAETPGSVRRLLRRCLERNPKNRLHDMADARVELEEALSGAPERPAAMPRLTTSTCRGSTSTPAVTGRVWRRRPRTTSLR